MKTISGTRIHITGIVQGVGFRPFVYGLAMRLALKGWVRNTSAGVDIAVDGPPEALQAFVQALRQEAPPLARIDALEVSECPADGFNTFEIIDSAPLEGAFQPISPDVCVCNDCLRELFDPQDRRYRYPFINCTNCGPRFTIIEDIPYDRPKTTMAPFAMCSKCAAEYTDPLDRRFHAQPVACPECGPEVWLENSVQHSAVSSQPAEVGRISGHQAIEQAQQLLLEGKILAVKGLGGFHLACDATNRAAVAELRRRKLRVDKPFALMMLDIETVLQHCRVNLAERELLESPQRPIVILQRKPDTSVAPEVAPRQDTLGVMLPYTPLHYLLLSKDEGRYISGERNRTTHSSLNPPPSSLILVMTSGNLSEEPIATANQEARQRLASLADAFLMHNREIRTRCDDSVARVFTLNEAGKTIAGHLPARHPPANNHPSPVTLRRSRGYAPDPFLLPWELPPLLAAGAELKNTFCLTRGRYAFLSHHIGDLENWETLQSFEDGVAHFERLFRIQPEVLVYDLHPNYLSTRWVMERANQEGLPAVGVQHHHAHIAACMAEHGLPNQAVIGVAFDGTGYGEDSAIWGGEFLLANYQQYERMYHLAYIPLPGGDASVRKPARTALAHLWAAGLDWEPELPCTQALCSEERVALRAQLVHRINAPLTSSMGRLFDAVAAVSGVRQRVNYEAQAAIELEALVDPMESGAYPFDIQDSTISPAPMWATLVNDVLRQVPVAKIAARFHNGTADLVSRVCLAIRKSYRQAHPDSPDISTVILSGGVWQNFTLLAKTLPRLQEAGFTVYTHRYAPPNDGGLALGQAAVAYHRWKAEDRNRQTVNRI